MGYDLHVVRTLDWLEAAKSPITREEVDRLIDQDPELQWSPSDYVESGWSGGGGIKRGGRFAPAGRR